ncbi:hypothetical protein OsJ_31795 [Oryza sativa Japonica Group]|uniref:Uncharacterized protein n=2 Tax=Oryza sativa subsp. japonica TaxID=39947 RepID=A3C5H0_ORYSJ|nr:hypothetical protein [Oryza sativa Japonica Group]AAP54132.1 hypothetical protein LOC_Os10g32280 [Oryza sativa Japonica Group]EAZ16333.1 hypothetical protein OsJ_31795 [Oryza sativa Japonica Group]
MRRQTTAADEEAVDGSEKAAAPAAQEDGEDVVDSSEKAAAAAAPVAQQDSEEAVDGLEKAAAVQEESRAVAWAAFHGRAGLGPVPHRNTNSQTRPYMEEPRRR